MRKIIFSVAVFAAVLLISTTTCTGQSVYHPEAEDYVLSEETEIETEIEIEVETVVETVEEADQVNEPDIDERQITNPIIIPDAAPWQEAYTEILWNYYANVPPMEYYVLRYFFLHDIDGDGIPELFIVYIQAGIWSQAIYTFTDGRIIQIEGNFFAYYGIYPPINRSGLIIQAYGSTDLMILEDGGLVVELALRQPTLWDHEERWYINDIEVSRDEFTEMYNSIKPLWDGDSGNGVNIRPDRINEDNIRDVISGWTGLPAPVVTTIEANDENDDAKIDRIIYTIEANHIYIYDFESDTGYRILREGDEFLGLTLREIQSSVLQYADNQFNRTLMARASFSGDITVHGIGFMERLDDGSFTHDNSRSAFVLAIPGYWQGSVPWFANEYRWWLGSWGCGRIPLYITNFEMITELLELEEFWENAEREMDVGFLSHLDVGMHIKIRNIDLAFNANYPFGEGWDYRPLVAEIVEVLSLNY